MATELTQMPFTSGLGKCRPKSSMSAAPAAGNSGTIQMLERKNISALYDYSIYAAVCAG
jgi:hypothetical protein